MVVKGHPLSFGHFVNLSIKLSQQQEQKRDVSPGSVACFFASRFALLDLVERAHCLPPHGHAGHSLALAIFEEMLEIPIFTRILPINKYV